MTQGQRPQWLADALRSGSRARRAAPIAALLLLLIVLSMLFSRPAPTGLPLDPHSTANDGTKALTLVLDRLGAQVEILDAQPHPEVDVVLVLIDNLDVTTAERLRNHTRVSGGTLVVTDPGGHASPNALVSGAASSGLVDAVLRGGCDIPALADVEEVRVGLSSLLEGPDAATSCFPRETGSWLVVEPLGAGMLVTTGGPAFVTNALLGEADNAVLAAALLAPRPGTRVGIVSPDFAPASTDDGANSLSDLIPLSLRLAALQLVVAFLLVALWRARRLGKPVAEPQEVRLRGSELVIAVGTLLHRTSAHERAVALLRSDLRRTLSERLGLPEDAEAQQFADTAAVRTSVRAEDVLAVLAGPAPRTDVELVALAQRAEAVRHALVVPVTSGA